MRTRSRPLRTALVSSGVEPPTDKAHDLEPRDAALEAPPGHAETGVGSDSETQAAVAGTRHKSETVGRPDSSREHGIDHPIFKYMHSCGNEVSVHSDSSSDDVVAEVSAEAVPPRDGDEQKDNVGARIGERVMTKLSHTTDRIVSRLLAEGVASGHAESNKNGVARRIWVVHDYTAVNYYSEAFSCGAFQMRVHAIRQILLVLWSTELLWVSSSRSLALASLVDLSYRQQQA
jgi:hypothetical protein